MATSKETRVRVEGFSKIMASTAPRCSLRFFGTRPLRFIAAALSMMVRSALRSSASISMKCLRDMDIRRSGVSQRAAFQGDASGIEFGACQVNLCLARDERRQEAHDIVASLHREHLLG